MSNRPGPLLAGVAALVVLGTVAAGLFVVGSPAAERRRQGDQTRVAHLGQIARAVNLHWTRHRAIPATLGDIVRDGQAALPQEDPVTGAGYEYRVIDARRFELCAHFEGASESAATGTFWHHRAGRQCFRLEVEDVHP
ncbi:MAG: hypothetical protein GEU82_18565 [Luteitalea sp.]|nr:hypothetical protein [Luteitalea sp.]